MARTPKATAAMDMDFTFFVHLRDFYRENRGRIRQHYKELSRRFLDYNNPENTTAFLREPQFEALEMYIFLKEFLGNAKVHKIFKDWTEKKGKFEGRKDVALLEQLNQQQYDAVFKRMIHGARTYPNYIFALTMGTGKTILMATCIFYEFILANKFPKDKRFCHNALVFAPDRTVLQALREIETMLTADLARVVPPEYRNFLQMNVKFHFLEEAGTALSTIDRSRFNLIVSNTQKIILKKKHKDPTAADNLFKTLAPAATPAADAPNVYEQIADLYSFDQPENEIELTTNQRFQKLQRLEQLGIYVDEAHHAFGAALAKDMGVGKATDTSLRTTIDELAASLDRAGTHVVACYNYTGTPYVGREVLPEVVYAYGLKDAIDKGFLKKVTIHSYTTTRDVEFIKLVIDHFVKNHQGQRHEGMLPKLAFFASSIDELNNHLRPAVEKALAKHGISADSILINVGDDKLTTNDDIREFNRLDTPDSTKQFILLVNKGREGWNCRSLFGVALLREPKSKVFVLQATMRCLRQIGETQQTGQIYLTEDNKQILDNELQQNFRISTDDFQKAGAPHEPVKVHVVKPVPVVKMVRIRRQYNLEEKQVGPGISLELAKAETEKYRLIHTTQEGLTLSEARRTASKTEDLTHLREKRPFSRLTLVAEVARYLNKPCLVIEDVLEQCAEGIADVLKTVNEFNELLYDWIIPRLFKHFYDLNTEEKREEYLVELVKIPPSPGYYQVTAAPKHIVRSEDPQAKGKAKKSFHLDTYCFDSNPEQELFWRLLADKRVKKLYFTGMLTHGQSDFCIQYIDPESHTVRTYYPDFLFQKNDDTYVIVEVKGENMMDDAVVQAKKEFAAQMAVASSMTYHMIGSKSVVSDIETLLQ